MNLLKYFLKTNTHLQSIALLIVFILAVFFRIGAYYNRTSIGNNDTHKFIECSRIPFFTTQFFTSNRPPTITLFYKIIEPPSGYEFTFKSEPGLEGRGSEIDRKYQPGLDQLALAQSGLSLFCWTALAFVVSRRIKHFGIKLIAAIMVFFFAFTPQLADWDGVLLSESISFALFALVFALTIEFSFILTDISLVKSKWIIIFTCFWIFSIVLWVFSRDSNAYFIFALVTPLVLPLMTQKFRQIISKKNIIFVSIILLFIFGVHNISLRSSDRWINPFFNNLMVDILPYPDRVADFQSMGMPVSEELLSFRNKCCGQTGYLEISEFMTWVNLHGYSAYSLYLIEHPVWAFDSFYKSLDELFSENRQPYFWGTLDTTPMWLIPVGDILHPRSKLVLPFDLTLLAAFAGFTIKKGGQNQVTWLWLLWWFYIGMIGLLFVSYHGDAAGLIRHALVAVIPLRLFLWLSLLVFSDAIIDYWGVSSRVG